MIRKSRVFTEFSFYSNLQTRITANFSCQSIRVPLIEPLTNSPTDYHLNRYSEVFSAYLTKRRVTRQQIWPKMYITQGNPSEQLPHLSYQRLYPLKKALRQSMLAKITRRDPVDNINSAFVISVFTESHFKEMMDQYVKKVLICGKCPQKEQQYEVQAKIIDLFRMFYYGEKLIPLERQIELIYLSLKQEKWRKYSSAEKKNAFLKCVWRRQDQRIVEDLANFRSLDMNYSDENYRPFFQPLNVFARLPHARLARQLINNYSWYERMMFKIYIQAQYKKTESFYQWITQVLLVRIYHWTQSEEFTQLMKIPPDYVIEKSIFQMHVWMIVDRLRTINSRQSRYIATKLMHGLRTQLDLSIGSLNVKRKALLEKNIAKMIDMNSSVLSMHFKHSNLTKDNPYLGIDALVWSLAFTEKVERYSDQVYLFSEYLVKSYQHIQRHSEQDILNGIAQFDVFLVDPNYKQKIERINPPLSTQQFEREVSLDTPYKKYSYNNIQKEAELPIHSIKTEQSKLTISFREILDSIVRGILKYDSLQSFDHYGQMDRKKKQMQLKRKTNPWKSQYDRIDDFQAAYQQIESIKSQRKKFSSNLKKDQ